MLDLCTRAIPSTDFEVIYSDTGYELPPSLDLYDKIQKQYKEKFPDLKFSLARNHDSVLNYWDKIGTPSDTHRWCCSVMKTAPLISEMEIVKKAIEKIITTYAGKKIAIVSDHGLTYLSQLQEGLNLAGFEADHHGRLAVCKSGKATQDKNYIVLDDGCTVCALKHRSLCNKIPRDQGIHGGCTPEEVLVPIFVISSNPSNSHWSTVLLTPEVSATDPVVRLQLKGLSKTDVPYIIYNNKSYQLSKVEEDEYSSERFAVDENVSDIRVLVSGTEVGTLTISWKMGAKEDDLFSDF